MRRYFDFWLFFPSAVAILMSLFNRDCDRLRPAFAVVTILLFLILCGVMAKRRKRPRKSLESFSVGLCLGFLYYAVVTGFPFGVLCRVEGGGQRLLTLTVISGLEQDIGAFQRKHKRLPSSLKELLSEEISGSGYEDGWGRKIKYEIHAKTFPTDSYAIYRLISAGEDGVIGTKDDIEKVIRDQR